MNPTIRNTARPIAWIKEGACFRCTSHTGDSDGYPLLRRGNIRRKICRWILLKRFPKLNSGVVCRHTCDNKWCINPDHITHGSVADNNRDYRNRILNIP